MIRDAAVIELLSGDNTLLDAVLVEVNARCVESGSAIDLRFNGRRGSQFSDIILTFTEIIKFSVLYEMGDIPLDVWDLKFIRLKDGSYYITLDPDPSTLGAAGVKELDASDTDGFVVHASHVEVAVTDANVT